MMTYVIEEAIKNGMYLRIEADIKKHEKSILRGLDLYKDEPWLRKWLTKKIIGRSRVSNRYIIIVDDILRNKYGVP